MPICSTFHIKSRVGQKEKLYSSSLGRFTHHYSTATQQPRATLPIQKISVYCTQQTLHAVSLHTHSNVHWTALYIKSPRIIALISTPQTLLIYLEPFTVKPELSWSASLYFTGINLEMHFLLAFKSIKVWKKKKKLLNLMLPFSNDCYVLISAHVKQTFGVSAVWSHSRSAYSRVSMSFR